MQGLDPLLLHLGRNVDLKILLCHVVNQERLQTVVDAARLT